MNIQHYPRLDTILMVENTLKDLDYHPTRKELWTSLPKKVQYQTFKVIIQYLEESQKIIIQHKNIIWIHNPELIKKSVGIEL